MQKYYFTFQSIRGSVSDNTGDGSIISDLKTECAVIFLSFFVILIFRALHKWRPHFSQFFWPPKLLALFFRLKHTKHLVAIICRCHETGLIPVLLLLRPKIFVENNFSQKWESTFSGRRSSLITYFFSQTDCCEESDDSSTVDNPKSALIRFFTQPNVFQYPKANPFHN